MRTTAVVAIALAALVLAGAFVLYSTNSSQHPPPTSTESTSSTSSSSASPSVSVTSNSSSWTVIRTNTTLHYGLACTPLGLFEMSCPTIDKALHSPSLSNVDVVSYRGEELYDVNSSYVINGQRLTYTIGFNNDTVVCVSPSYDGYVLCPVHPIFPTIGIITPSASALNASNGLRLDLELSNSTEGVNVTVGVYNTLDTVNNVTSASDWAIYSNSLNDICGNQVAAFAVYQGNYGAGNFTASSPLAMDNVQGGSVCPELSPSVVYSFSPDSGVASIQAGRFASGPSSMNVTLSYTTSGYSTCGVKAPSFEPSDASGLWVCAQDNAYKFNPFPPGTYTVVGLDQWGDVAILHFVVAG
jgi:hypothetical protein